MKPVKTNRERKAKWLVPLLLFIGIIIDAALPAIFPGAFIGSTQIIVSHLVLYYIVTFSFYLRDTNILFYAFIFGLLYESYMATLLGLYASLYFLIAYLIIKECDSETDSESQWSQHIYLFRISASVYARH